MAIPVMIRLVVPTLVNVTVWAGLVVNSNTEPKFRLVGESFAVVPIPLRLTFCGLPEALSLMFSAAVRVPDARGLNVTLMVQLASTANELPHVWFCAKSLALFPVIAMSVMLKVLVP